MSKRSLFVTLVVASASLAVDQSAHAAVPGTPCNTLLQADVVTELREGSHSEIKTWDLRTLAPPIAGGINEGFIVLTPETDGGSGNWSDVIVFHDNANVPTSNRGCPGGVNFATIISDPISEAALPTSGCLMSATAHNPPCAPLKPEYASVPANLQNLTVEDVQLALAAANPPLIAAEQEPLAAGGNGLKFTVGGFTYYLISDVPALPPWAFALLGATLLGTAGLAFRRFRGQSMTAV